MSNQKRFGALLRTYRETFSSRGSWEKMSQEKLGKKWGCTGATIGLRERGVFKLFPPREELIQLKKILELSDAQLDEILILAGYAPIQSHTDHPQSQSNHSINVVVPTINPMWQNVKYRLAAERYQMWIMTEYDKMHIFGMGEPVPLQGIYTDVYMLEQQRALRQFGMEALREQFGVYGRHSHEREARQEGLAIVGARDKLFILGKPGAGKTTFCKYVAVEAARENRALGGARKLPIFIELKKMAREFEPTQDGILAYIEQEFEVCEFPSALPFIEQLLTKGEAVVLFDGLDEVQRQAGERNEWAREIAEFARRYSGCHIVVTCRIAAVQYTFEGFTYAEMADFTQAQRDQFVRNWFMRKAVMRENDIATQMIADLDGAHNASVAELTANPLLLTLLCLTYEKRFQFPNRRADIYEEAIDALLTEWDASRVVQRREDMYGGLGRKRKVQMLGRIAYDQFVKGEFFFERNWLEAQLVAYMSRVPDYKEVDPIDIDGRAILRSIIAEHGFFTERAVNIFSFSHLTFQEYFTAQHIVQNERKGTLDILAQNFTHSKWRETTILSTSLLDEADEWFHLALDKLHEDLLGDNASVQMLFSWANEKANDKRVQNYDYSSVHSHVLFRGLHNDSKFVTTRSSDSDFTDDRDLTRGRARNFFIDLNFDLALDFIFTIEPVLAHDQDFERTFDSMIELSKKLDFVEMHQKLSQLPRPKQNWSNEQIQEWVARLEKIVEEEHPQLLAVQQWSHELFIGYTNIEFIDNEAADFLVYIKGLALLADCLDVAYVVDRPGIEARFFRPV